MNLPKTEPVLSYGLIVAVISAGIAMAMSLGWIELTEQQFTDVMLFVSAFMVLGAAIVRQYVTPLVNPKDSDGEPLTRSDNSPALKAQK